MSLKRQKTVATLTHNNEKIIYEEIDLRVCCWILGEILRGVLKQKKLPDEPTHLAVKTN